MRTVNYIADLLGQQILRNLEGRRGRALCRSPKTYVDFKGS